MKCATYQRRISSLDDPEKLPPSIQGHVDECAPCREWHRRVIQLDQHAVSLPVPSSIAGAAFIHQLRKESRLWDSLRRGASTTRRFWMAAGSLAAGILVLILVWKLVPSSNDVAKVATPAPVQPVPAVPDAFLASLMQRNLALAGPMNEVQRVETLQDLADDLFSEVHGQVLAMDQKELMDLAKLYGDVVQKEVKRAREVPAPERTEVVKRVTRRLAWTSEDASSLAQKIRVPSSDHALPSIARSADKARSDLEGLVKDTVSFRKPARMPQYRMELPSMDKAALAFRGTPIIIMGGFNGPVAKAIQPAPPAPAPEPNRAQRNSKLVRTLVEGSLCLADSPDDPLARAACCKSVAKGLADEVERAAQDRDDQRVGELGQHFAHLLQRGVADNLGQARASIKRGSEQETELARVADEVAGIVKPLEEKLQSASDIANRDPVRRTLRGLSESRDRVENALKRSDFQYKTGE